MPAWVRAWGERLRRGWAGAGRPTWRGALGALLVPAGGRARAARGRRPGAWGSGPWPAALVGGVVSCSGAGRFYAGARPPRRDRYFLLRCAYALLLLGVLCWVHLGWFGGQDRVTVWFEEGAVQAKEMAR